LLERERLPEVRGDERARADGRGRLGRGGTQHQLVRQQREVMRETAQQPQGGGPLVQKAMSFSEQEAVKRATATKSGAFGRH
ncbi:MAG: hypothetical protein ACO26Y_01865, partial [Burkholderiaceae bacterium]